MIFKGYHFTDLFIILTLVSLLGSTRNKLLILAPSNLELIGGFI